MDIASTLAMKRFLVRLTFFVVLDMIVGRRHMMLASHIADWAAAYLGCCAMLTREPVAEGPLNRWDEAAVFLGLHCLAVLGRHSLGLP